MAATALEPWRRPPLDENRAHRAAEWLRSRNSSNRLGTHAVERKLTVRGPEPSSIRRRVAQAGWDRAVRSAPRARSLRLRGLSALASAQVAELPARLRPARAELGRGFAVGAAAILRWCRAFASAVGAVTIALATLIGRFVMFVATAIREAARHASAGIPSARERSRVAAAAGARALSVRAAEWGEATKTASVRTARLVSARAKAAGIVAKAASTRTARMISARAASAGTATRRASSRAGGAFAAGARSLGVATRAALFAIAHDAWVCILYPPRLVGRAAVTAGDAFTDTIRRWRRETVDAVTGVGRAVASAPARIREARIGSRALASTGRFLLVSLYFVALIAMVGAAVILGAYAATVR